MQLDRSLSHLWPQFGAKIAAVVADLSGWCATNWPGHRAAVAEGFRTTERQQHLYAQGRTAPGEIVTHDDGVTHRSSHQSGLAADVVGLTAAGYLTWDCPAGFWDALTRSAHAHGLQRIMDYSDFTDLPHVQWPLADHVSYAEAKSWLQTRGLA